MADYRDPSRLDPNGNFSITQLVKFIREKLFGIDVREAIAKALEKVYEDASKEGNANMEVSQARGIFGLLKDRLDNSDTRVAQKADRTYVDAVLSSIAAGGPKELFYSLAALQTKYPNGAEGTYLVFDVIHEDSAHSYIWNGSNWEDLGPYQAMEVGDRSLTSSKYQLGSVQPIALSKEDSVLGAQEILMNKGINVYNTTTQAPIIIDRVGYCVIRYKVPEDVDSVEFVLTPNESGQFMLAYGSSDDSNRIWNIAYNQVVNGSFIGHSGQSYVTSDKTRVGIYGKNSDRATNLNMIDHVYVVFKLNSGGDIIRKGYNNIQALNLSDGTIPGEKVKAPTDKLSSRRFNLNQIDTELIPHYLLQGEDSNGNVLIRQLGAFAYARVPIEKLTGEVMVTDFVDNIGSGQAFVFVDSNEKVVIRIGQNHVELNKNGPTLNNTLHRYFSVKNGKIYVYLATILGALPSITAMYIGTSITCYNEGLNLYMLDSIEQRSAYPWLKKHYQLQEPSLSIDTIYGRVSTGYNTGTRLMNVSVHDGAFMKYYQVPESGIMKVPKPKLRPLGDGSFFSFQWMYLLDKDDKVMINFAFNNSTGEIQNGYPYTVTEDEVIFDFSKFGSAKKFVLTFMSWQLDTFYEKYEQVFELGDLFKDYKQPEESLLTDEDFLKIKYIPSISGEENYLYFDNFLTRRNIYADNIAVSGSGQRNDKVIINATQDYTHRLTYDTFNLDTPVRIASKTAGSGQQLNIMVIGESTSQAGPYMQSLKEYFDNDVVDVNFVGTRESSGVQHEAYSGWGAGTLRYCQSANNHTNAFYNPETNEFDVNYYFNQNTNLPYPDIVVINFGINGENRYVTDGRGGTQTQHFEFFINQFKTKNPECKFLIGLTNLTNRHDNFNQNTTRLSIVDRLQQTIFDFEEQENEGIYLNPMFANVDMLYDMLYEEIDGNRFNPNYKLMRGADLVHPDVSGYKATAYMTYVSLKYLISQED